MKRLSGFPDEVRRGMGFGLRQAQDGGRHIDAKSLGNTAIELLENYDTDTYRGIYTIKFEGIVYVLHCFMKKSKKGIATPLADVELIKSRYKAAEKHYKEHYSGKNKVHSSKR